MSDFMKDFHRIKRVRVEMPLTVISGAEYNIVATNEAMETREIKIWQDNKLVVVIKPDGEIDFP